MIHKPILINNLGLSFLHKVCFEHFSAQVNYGDRIAIIGRNGSGKSTLLNILRNAFEPTTGNIHIPETVIFGYVPQIIETKDTLSGGQRFNKALTVALSCNPNVLLLDEPTNHLDLRNRTSLMRMLKTYQGTLIVVSHDVELLRTCTDTLWHIDKGTISIFSGGYDNYMHEIRSKQSAIEQQLSHLKKQKKDTHHSLMKEQQRARKQKAYGEKKYGSDPLALSAAQSQGETTHNKKRKLIDTTKTKLVEQLSNLQVPEIIIPTFSLSSANIGNRTLVSIREGSVAYHAEHPLISHISLSLSSGSRTSISGDNGSGKSTLIKAILGDETITKNGDWLVPKKEDIGYLDQHYSTLSPANTVLETIATLTPNWPQAQIRRHLNTFLFRKNEEVNALVSTLSGGEKARLSLACIAAKTPTLLILDEITNNLDLETRQHVIEVLKYYPGTIIIISHDTDFLKKIDVQDQYLIAHGTLTLNSLHR